MPQTWIYVLRSSTRYFYVGQTDRLIRRMKEHTTGRGALCTREFCYDHLVGLYKLGDSEDFSEFETRQVEDNITLQLMKIQDNPRRVRGGRWTLHGITQDWNAIPISELKTCPMPVVCDCGMPAERFTSKQGQEYYRCSLSNTGWIDTDSFPVSVEPACSFFIAANKAVPSSEPNYCPVCAAPCGHWHDCLKCRRAFVPDDFEIVDTSMVEH